MGSNHLGNVLTIFTDRKLPIDADNNGIIDAFWPDVIASNDYMPFGALLTERTFKKGTFPNSFNGKRDDKEINDMQDYGAREYIPKGREFLSVDPLTSKFPMLTPYQFASNTPLMAIDLDGLEAAGVQIGGRVTVPFFTIAASVDIIADAHQVSFFITPAAGVGTGIGGGAGVSIVVYPTAPNSESVGGWGAEVGGSIGGNEIDLKASIQQEKSGKPKGVEMGVSFPSGIGGGAGVEAHADVSYSFLLGTIPHNKAMEMIKYIAEETGIPVNVLTEAYEKAQAVYKENFGKKNSETMKKSADNSSKSSTTHKTSSKESNKNNQKGTKKTAKTAAKKDDVKAKKEKEKKSANNKPSTNHTKFN